MFFLYSWKDDEFFNNKLIEGRLSNSIVGSKVLRSVMAYRAFTLTQSGAFTDEYFDKKKKDFPSY